MAKDRKAGGGCFLRKSSGMHVANGFYYYGDVTSNYTEIKELLDGLYMCQSHSIYHVCIRSDLALVINCLKGTNKVPWNLKLLWRKIHAVMLNMHWDYAHAYI